MQSNQPLTAVEITRIRNLYIRHGFKATAMLSDHQARAVSESLARGELIFHGLIK